MVNTRNTDARLDALEKVAGDLEKKSDTMNTMLHEVNIQIQSTNVRVTAIDSKLDSIETFMTEMRAALANGIPIIKPTGSPSDPDPGSHTTGSGGTPPMTIPTFDGSDALACLARAEQYFMVSNVLPENRIGVAMVALAGPALPWYQLLRRRIPNLTWDQFTRELMKRFGDKMALDGYEAFAATRHDGSLVDFVAAFEGRLAQISDLADHQYLGFFLAALRPDIRMHMKAANITTYSDAVQLALSIDQSSGGFSPSAVSTLPPSNPPQSFGRPVSKGFSQTPPSFAPTASSRPPPRRFRNMSTEEYKKHLAAGTCFKCGLKFGPAHRCPPKTLNVLVCDDDDGVLDDDTTAECEGHPSEVELQLSEMSFNGLDTSYTMQLFGDIGVHRVKVMVDSGASHCFISKQLAQLLELPITATTPYSVLLGDGSRVQAAGICHGVPLQLAAEVFTLSCYVFPLRNVDIILGVSWLRVLGDVTANWENLSMKFSVNGRTVALEGDPTLTRRVCSSRDINSLETGDSCWVLHTMEGGVDQSSFGFEDRLSAAARGQLHEIIEAFPTVCHVPATLPPARRTDHRIPLHPGSQPVSVRPYRYNHLQKDEMEKLVAEMLASGVIQPSSSPYSSPVLLVRKKDGSWRFCVDYRELNKRTIPDKYPIPIIQELLDELHGSRWFSKLDLKAGYHQIRVAATDVHKTAFRTHSGHYEFLVMPFGLTNAPATFQSLMNDIFRPFLRRFVLVFFDDILVYSTSWAAHLQHLRQVFAILQQHSLVVNPKKCLLGRTSVEYLGHIVSFEGVQMDPAKISSVLRWPTPTSLKGVRGFLGLTGYYRRFIRDYGKIAAPLTTLLKKTGPVPQKKPWVWPAEAEAAFTALKTALTTAPLLRMPDFSKSFVIECDASGRGLGAVLMQDRQPVAYFSKTLSDRWLAKSAYEKELMALVLAIHHWRPYLLGRHFVVHTDQRSLKQLLAHPLSTPAQQNWAAKLLGYDFTILYKDGRLNRAADALSRRDEDSVEFAALSRPTWPAWSDVQSSLSDDPNLAKIKAELEAGRPTTPHYELIHGVLFYKGRIVIPPQSQWIPKLLAEFHLTPAGGHAGAYRTYRRLATNVYWPGMVKQVTNFVAACATCQKHKSDTHAPAGLLNPLPIPERIWEDISMDFLSGLPKAGGVDCVFVVVDRLSKYAHFIALRHPFSARQVADLFAKEIVRLHGIPRSIVSDRDPIFISAFWQELFRATGTKLRMSSAYHPETDGQTEVMNRCLQTYLRCFSSDRPKTWNRWLSWAEYCYNTSAHSASGTTPFEVVYGRPPPTLHDYLPGEIRSQAVVESLRSRDEALAVLRHHLLRTQQRMTATANTHRRDVEFEVGDLVYLKFRPYRQSTLFEAANRKLAPRYFGPFRVEARIGPAAYRLKLPDGSRIHPVFHVSLLKKAIGAEVPEQTLPNDLMEADPPCLPEKVLDRRSISVEGVPVEQVLVKWIGLGDEEASWMNTADVRGQFPYFRLADKAVLADGAVDTTWKVFKRGNRKVVWPTNSEGREEESLPTEKEILEEEMIG